MDSSNINYASTAMHSGSDPYANKNDPYAAKDPYANKSDPYANKRDPYATDQKEQDKAKKPFWDLEFEIVRFFRENYNAGVDFEESPKNFFDEQYIFDLKIRLLQRVSATLIVKFLTMALFTVSALFLSINGMLIAGAIYTILFLYYIAVPIAFVKYNRQYIVDDTPRGKLRKIHIEYANWFRPLEVIGMNLYTIFFMIVQVAIIFNANHLVELVKEIAYSHINNHKIVNFFSTLNPADIQNSSLIALAYYGFSYFIYIFFIYKLWTPKWEKVRLENEKAYKFTNQRMAKNLKDALLEH